jgi:hypothetical protein
MNCGNYWDPETQQESLQWKHDGSPTLKKFWTLPSVPEIMILVVWDLEGILLVDYMPHKTTITGNVHAAVLWNLEEAIKG